MKTVKTEAQRKKDFEMFGMGEGTLRNVIKNDPITQLTGDYSLLATSFMSNAQEKARQSINCAKFILVNFVMNQQYKKAA
jgi:hypothetical protein